MTAFCTLAAMGLMMVFGGLTIAAAVLGGRAARMNAAYREVARQLKGRFRTGGWFRCPTVQLRYGETVGTLVVVKVRGVRCTQLTVDRAGAATDWEAFTGTSETGRSLPSWEEVKIGDSRVASTWRLRAAETTKVQSLLTDGVCWQLERLVNARPHVGLVVQRTARRFVIRCETVLGDWRSLAEFVRYGFELFDQLSMVHGTEIEFVDGVEATLLEAVICPVCGDPIDSQLVYCAVCKTPHHQDCWDYNSRCSTFACGERTYCVPQVAIPIARNSPATTSDTKFRDSSHQSMGGNGEGSAEPQ